MAQLPDHITDLILLNLPVKTLLRFRSVCKRWNDTVTSTSFAKQHMKSVAGTPAACCNFFYSKASSCNQFCPRLSVFRISSDGRVRVTGRVLHTPFRVGAAGVRKTWIHHSSCNGLLFMVELGEEVRSSFICLWNPATGEHKEAAWPRSLTDMDANVMHGWVGFGHAPRVDDHKIVVMCDSGRGWRIQTLSLKINAWRAVAASPCLDSVRGGIDQQMNSVAVDGSVYWIVSVKTTEDGISYDNGLLRFDLDEESFQILPFPEGLRRRRDAGTLQKLGRYNGRLCLYKWEVGLNYYYTRKMRSAAVTTKIDVWVLQGQGAWCKVVSVPTLDYGLGIRRGGTGSWQQLYPVGFSGDGRIIMVNNLDQSLVCYVPGENKFVMLGNIYVDEGSTRPYGRGWDLHFLEMETLLSP